MAAITINAKRIRPLDGALTRHMKLSGRLSSVGRCISMATKSSVPPMPLMPNTVTGNIGLLVAGTHKRTDGTLADGETVSVLFWGPVWLGGAAMDITLPAFLADSPGQMADTAGTNSRQVGAPLGPDKLFFNGIAVS